MHFFEIGQDKIKVSALSLGAWGMGGGTSWRGSDDDASIRVIHEAKELGINLIDTAPVYGTGHSEEIVGRALAGRRSDYILSTKCTLHWRDETGQKLYERDGRNVYKCFAADSLRLDLEGSLKRLRTDYIDIYITHRQPDDPAQIPEIYGALEKFRAEGKIRAIGISNASPALLREYLKCGPVELAQEKFSLLESEPAEEYIPLCDQNSVLFQGFSVLERGLLTGKLGMDYKIAPGEAREPIQWFEPHKRSRVLAMLDGWRPLCEELGCSLASLVTAYTIACSPSLCVLFGASRPESLRDTAKAIHVKLGEDALARMRADVAKTLKA